MMKTGKIQLKNQVCVVYDRDVTGSKMDQESCVLHFEEEAGENAGTETTDLKMLFPNGQRTYRGPQGKRHIKGGLMIHRENANK